MRKYLLPFVVMCPAWANAAVINVQPIQVCDNAGANCAGVNTFDAYTSKIYAQRGDSVNFLPLKQLNSTAYLNLETTGEADALIGSTTGTQRTDNAYDMWFVSSITGGTRAGRAAVGGDGVVISDDIIALNRVDTVPHELAHNLGFGHSSETQLDADRFLMAPGSIRRIPMSLGDVAPDGLQLDRFDPILPKIRVDTIGSTPYEATDFFNVEYLEGAAVDLFLDRLTVNLGPAGAFTDPTDSPPGESGSGFGFSNLNGISASDITVSGISDGSSLFSLDFAQGSFAPNDSFSFGVDIDLFSAIDAFGATPDELRNAIITFSFSNGYSVSNPLDDLIAESVFDPTANYDLAAFVFSDPDPLRASPVPVPGAGPLLLFGLGALGVSRRMRRSA